MRKTIWKDYLFFSVAPKIKIESSELIRCPGFEHRGKSQREINLFTCPFLFVEIGAVFPAYNPAKFNSFVSFWVGCHFSMLHNNCQPMFVLYFNIIWRELSQFKIATEQPLSWDSAANGSQCWFRRWLRIKRYSIDFILVCDRKVCSTILSGYSLIRSHRWIESQNWLCVFYLLSALYLSTSAKWSNSSVHLWHCCHCQRSAHLAFVMTRVAERSTRKIE